MTKERVTVSWVTGSLGESHLTLPYCVDRNPAAAKESVKLKYRADPTMRPLFQAHSVQKEMSDGRSVTNMWPGLWVMAKGTLLSIRTL
mmetsp:Transcript_7963/g.18438  ORF Transcript_7963/g.18438 Transcript_7963/m.18438 type:complete len:88 (+) Transcript_7963:173-436(+)